jgi:ABC-type glutathione transport system ATPase component
MPRLIASDLDLEKFAELKASSNLKDVEALVVGKSSFTASQTTLAWKDLTVSTKAKYDILKLSLTSPQTLLKGVSGSINGGIWGIMGPSGSGKTTFLSALAHRTDHMNISGYVPC